MTKGDNQKLKLLYLTEILMRQGYSAPYFKR